MFSEFIGKYVEITVAFALGESAAIYTGKLLRSDAESSKLEINGGKMAMHAGAYATASKMAGVFGNVTSYDLNVRGDMIIRNQFIVSMLELRSNN